MNGQRRSLRPVENVCCALKEVEKRLGLITATSLPNALTAGCSTSGCRTTSGLVGPGVNATARPCAPARSPAEAVPVLS